MAHLAPSTAGRYYVNICCPPVSPNHPPPASEDDELTSEVLSSCIVLGRVLVPSTRTAIPWDDRAQFGSNCWRCVAKNIHTEHSHSQSCSSSRNATLRHGRIVREIWRKWKVKESKKKTFTAQPSAQTDDCQGRFQTGRLAGNIKHNIPKDSRSGWDNERFSTNIYHIIASDFRF